MIIHHWYIIYDEKIIWWAHDQDTMEADWAKWVARNKALKNADEEIDFQTDYVLDIARYVLTWQYDGNYLLFLYCNKTQGLRSWLPLEPGRSGHVQGFFCHLSSFPNISFKMQSKIRPGERFVQVCMYFQNLAGVAPPQGWGHPHLQGQKLCLKVHR